MQRKKRLIKEVKFNVTLKISFGVLSLELFLFLHNVSCFCVVGNFIAIGRKILFVAIDDLRETWNLRPMKFIGNFRLIKR